MPHQKYGLKRHGKPGQMLRQHQRQLNGHAVKGLVILQVPHGWKICRKCLNIRHRGHQKLIINQAVPSLGHFIHRNAIVVEDQAAIYEKARKNSSTITVDRLGFPILIRFLFKLLLFLPVRFRLFPFSCTGVLYHISAPDV